MCIRDSLTPTLTSTSPTKKADTAVRHFEDGLVIEMAGDGVPQNDLTIYSSSVFVGEEYKHYTQGGCVDMSVLRKRAYQMGYKYINVTVGVDESHVLQDGGLLTTNQGRDGTIESAEHNVDAKSVTVTLRAQQSGRSALGKYHALRMRQLAPHAHEYVVLCSPTRPLIPPRVTVAFSCRATPAPRVSIPASNTSNPPDTRVDYTWSTEQSCSVVCKTFSIPEYILRSTASTQPPNGHDGEETYQNDRGGSLYYGTDTRHTNDNGGSVSIRANNNEYFCVDGDALYRVRGRVRTWCIDLAKPPKTNPKMPSPTVAKQPNKPLH
eukprot:TRINITY_DN1025_c0_g1_i2.p1 TRINITY_DN1025_c0_g1~~TRINITY_DN1025_c0_g1_i2.p1  ORF type:complete len:322 (+),score=30.88 TRINITY_DN1025_c0_g1_i2:170-1135(+)